MDNFVLKIPRAKKHGGKGEVIRVTDEAYDILAGWSAESGRSISFIASEMIKHVSDYTVVEDDD